MVSTIFIALILLKAGNYALEDTNSECLSKFDLTFDIVEKLVDFKKQIQELKVTSARQQEEIDRLKSANKAHDDTYVRWGRTVCPGNGSELVYKGYMAGSRRDYKGTGSNYFCLTSEPVWDHFDTSIESLGKITGVEYEFYNHKDTGAAAFLGENMYNHKAPCAVCYTAKRTTVMIPGRNRCYDGWTEEYRGYLVSGYTAATAATEYICLDRRPEKLPNGSANLDENLLYFVEGQCGRTLTCPPYIIGRELTCVVCSF